jgi:hypothetical protein
MEEEEVHARHRMTRVGGSLFHALDVNHTESLAYKGRGIACMRYGSASLEGHRPRLQAAGNRFDACRLWLELFLREASLHS